MNQQYEPNQHIEVLIDQIEDAIDYAAAGNGSFTSKQVFNPSCDMISTLAYSITSTGNGASYLKPSRRGMSLRL